jgi:hypothetical protein
VPSTVHVYVPTAGLPGPLCWLGGGAGVAGLVGPGVRAAPDEARVVAVAAVGPDVAVVGPAEPVLRAVVAVVLDDALEPGVPGWAAAAVVAVVSAVATVEVVVPLLGGPAVANWPPRRKEGGPLWVSL